MAIVEEIRKDTFRVSEFLLAMPHVLVEIKFVANEPKIIFRHGYDGSRSDKAWDESAIRAVQFALITNTAIASVQAISSTELESALNDFKKYLRRNSVLLRDGYFSRNLEKSVKDWLAQEAQVKKFHLSSRPPNEVNDLIRAITRKFRTNWQEKAKKTRLRNEIAADKAKQYTFNF